MKAKAINQIKRKHEAWRKRFTAERVEAGYSREEVERNLDETEKIIFGTAARELSIAAESVGRTQRQGTK